MTDLFNTVQRTSMLITKNTFEVRSKDSTALIKVFFYNGVALAEQVLTFSALDNGIKIAVVNSEIEGHYFIVSGRNFQSLRKGYSPVKMFFYDREGRDDLVLNPSSYDNEGVYVGVNNYSYIGNGIYVVDPVGVDPTIVEIFGKIYHSFIYSPLVQTYAVCEPSTPIGLDIERRKFVIRVNDGEDPDFEVENYDPVVTIK